MVHPSGFGPPLSRPPLSRVSKWPQISVRVYTNLQLRDAINRKVGIDVNVLVSLVEDISAHVIVNHHQHSPRLDHPITLPRSWMIRILQQGGGHNPNGVIPRRLVIVLGTLLEILRSGNGGRSSDAYASLRSH